MRVAGIALCLAAAGCDVPPESRLALSGQPTADYDKRLIGTWILMMDNDPVVLRISAGESPRKLKLLWSLLQKEKAVWIAATAFATEIDGTVYYNVRRTPGEGNDYTVKGEQPGYLILRPVISGRDILFACFLHGRNWDNDRATEMFDKRGIRYRKVKGKDNSTYLLIESSRKELRALLRAAPAEELFGSALPYRRVGALPDIQARLKGWIKDRSKKTGCPFELAR